MLWGQTIVDGQAAHIGGACQPGDEFAMAPDRPQGVSATMQVQDHAQVRVGRANPFRCHAICRDRLTADIGR